jgi:hypothetical protein
MTRCRSGSCVWLGRSRGGQEHGRAVGATNASHSAIRSALPSRLLFVALFWPERDRTMMIRLGRTASSFGRSTLGAVTYTSSCFLWCDADWTITSRCRLAKSSPWQARQNNIRPRSRRSRPDDLIWLVLPLNVGLTTWGPSRRPVFEKDVSSSVGGARPQFGDRRRLWN